MARTRNTKFCMRIECKVWHIYIVCPALDFLLCCSCAFCWKLVLNGHRGTPYLVTAIVRFHFLLHKMNNNNQILKGFMLVCVCLGTAQVRMKNVSWKQRILLFIFLLFEIASVCADWRANSTVHFRIICCFFYCTWKLWKIGFSACFQCIQHHVFILKKIQRSTNQYEIEHRIVTYGYCS